MIAMDGVNSLVFKVETPERSDFDVVFNWDDIKSVMADKRAVGLTFNIEPDTPGKVRVTRENKPGIEWVSVVDQADCPDDYDTPKMFVPFNADFLDKFKKVIKFADKSGVRSRLSGALIEPGWVVASDGKRLARLPIDLGLREPVIVPWHKVFESETLTGNGEIGLTDNGERVTIKAGRWAFDSRLVEDAYPDYRSVIPARETLDKSLTFSQSDIELLTDTLTEKRLTSTSNIHPVHFVFSSRDVSVVYYNNDNPVTLEIETEAMGVEDDVISIDKRIVLEAFGLGLDTILFSAPESIMLAFGNGVGDMTFMPLSDPEPERAKEIVKDSVAVRGHGVANETKERTDKMTQENREKDVKPNVEFKGAKEDDNADGFDDLIEAATELKRAVAKIKEMVNCLPTKVREVRRDVKAKERMYENARDAIKQLQKVSGF